ncbi:phosphosulfolactate synthase [Bacillus atrophaeus]|jgi:phosphosulfolactate synthase|uniref:phosphosulfolactate synthase n=1 Tax=Bacillus atrophaeus TaxID=1452 RepID=UPI00077AC9BB|nr:phosphosulfolactate synthase [Bacillus atrophaeus]KXZ13968.1 phosphosulfolactate synthase [Bacillus atrophaeus]MCY8486743.1 phosphosulfolactate synthase [Bacillus atrophaeus]MCY8504634.1 phosphosulfolactate synthase [Bacillus atrophaeus]MCY8910281.1 phosphosulfolactate synthase [Bacillus atrophaeus]MCY8911836.1 phosphosulfolactate synthase [Bacillus atrophaeus]
MNHFTLDLPLRTIKPRKTGLTILIDNGYPLRFFKDSIEGAADYIDFVKFGWGTSLITKDLEEKISCLKENDVKYFFGGTLFEKYASQKKVDEFYRYCISYGCEYIEISNGTIPITNKEKAAYITDFSREFNVFSEVGSKDNVISNQQGPEEWIESILEDIEAGSEKVITEARESGTGGLCSSNGDIRFQITDDILSSGIDINKLIFEAPNKTLQTGFIQKAGPNVNMANISFQDVISLETLRLGLRSDTFYL